MAHHHGGGKEFAKLISESENVIALVGPPNVGKSVVFYRLTGRYAWVSNYPGTTVDLNVGVLKIGDLQFKVIDTPGMYSLYALSEDEKIARKILFELKPSLVIHVVDAKNLQDHLRTTLLLLEAGFNLILDVNAVDEAEKLGIKLDVKKLREKLRIPVVLTVATTGEGIKELKNEILKTLHKPSIESYKPRFSRRIEDTISRIREMLREDYPVSKRLLSTLLALGDREVIELVYRTEKNPALLRALEEYRSKLRVSLRYAVEYELRRNVNELLEGVIETLEGRPSNFQSKLSQYMTSPISGVLILVLVLLSLYFLVGYVGAQILVDYLEVEVFENAINPLVNDFLKNYSPHPWIYEILGGEYGVITLGLKYSFAIILPIVTLFFIAFSIIEDSGYLPRLAVLTDKMLKKVGLSGRAVIPLVLGTGCDTMATIVTRTLESRREKMIATLMLALGIPCSAQLGVVLGMLADVKSLALWLTIVAGVLIVVSYLASKILPGQNPTFIIELPPLRIPKLSNVLLKTWTRLEWYLKEVIPLFMLASVLIWAGRVTGVFDFIVGVLEAPTAWIGLPREAAVAFLYGFFRRDYGAAGLYDIRQLMSARQLLVSMVTITLFVPCIAQFLIMSKERGWKYTLTAVTIIIPLAFTVGYLVNVLTLAIGW